MKIHTFLILLFLPFPQHVSEGGNTHSKEQMIIHVVSQGWHSGLIIPADCLADSLWPQAHQYSQFDRLLIGWGDEDYYRNRGFNVWYAAKAAIWPTASTIHIKAFHHTKEIDSIIEKKVILHISKEDYGNLCKFIRKQFSINREQQLIPQGKGFYQNSQFFASNKKYTAFNNSNVWTARALKEAGFDLKPARYLTKGSILKKAEKLKAEKK